MNRHVEALAEEFLGRGHDVRVLAPQDPPGRVSRLLHRAAPEAREIPEYVTPLGRTMGFGVNGSVGNLAPFPGSGIVAPRREVRAGDFDVIHVHEPLAPLVGWNATLGARTPVVGTFHAYSTKPMPNYIANALGARRMFNRLSARIAVSEAAAWTGRRWYGGDYTIIPNGVDVDTAPDAPTAPGEELRILFVGRPEERKGLPILLTAFGALVEHVPCRLTVIGAEREDVLRYLPDPELLSAIDVRGRVSGEALGRAARRRRALRPLALGRELRHGADPRPSPPATPVIASYIAGYSDVVRDGSTAAGAARGPAALGRGAAAGLPPTGAREGHGRCRPPQRPALRLAPRRRPGDGGVRAGDLGAAAPRRRRARGALGRPPARRRRPPSPGAETALA